MADSNARIGSTDPLTLWGAALLLGVIACRATTLISPLPSFDVDPLQNAVPWLGIGPAGVLAGTALVLLASGMILAGERRAGRGVDRRLMLFAMLPLVPVLWHGLVDSGDLHRGLDWTSGALGAVALAHAVRGAGVRRLVLAGLAALISLLAVQGGFELLVEHPATVDYYEQNREQVLRSLGWQPDSIQADNYERRLLQPEASGWFGLANLFSGLMVAGILLLAGFMHRRLPGGSMTLLGLVAAGLFALVVVNGSKGALASLFFGVSILFLPLVFGALRDRGRGLPGWCALSGLLLAFLAVIVRSVLPEDALGGERSLLFRGQYLEAAMRMLSAHPWTGVGPTGFQELGLRFKSPVAPEDPMSAHNMVVDWLASYGLLAIGWVALLATLALRTGGALLAAPDPQVREPANAGARALVPFFVAILFAPLVGLVLELPALLDNPIALVMRALGIIVALGCLAVGWSAQGL